jgi:transglutaminase-like putative cysteine protease
MTLAAGWATALGAVPLGAVYESWGWLWYTWAAIGAVVAAHLLARSLRLPAWLVPVVGLLGLLEYLVIVFAGDRAFLGLLPGPGALRALHEGLQAGFLDVRELAAPVPVSAGLALLTAAPVGLVAIVVDIVAVVLRRPAAAGLALLALYAVPSAVAFSGVSWPLFVIGASGYLVLLMVEGRERLLRWGRPIGPAGTPDDAGEEAPLPLTGQRIGAAALAAAVIMPLFVPGLTTNALSKLGRTGVGDGTGTGAGSLSPFVALKGQLDRPEPRELFRVTVNPEAGDLWYLRLKVLERFVPGGWTDTGSRDEEGLRTLLSMPYGQVRGRPAAERGYTAQVTVTEEYRDDALPTFYAPLKVDSLGGEWEYNWRKGVLLTGSQQRGGFTYQIEGAEPRPTREELVSAGQLSEDDEVMRILGRAPASIPDLVRQRVEEITAGKSTPYERALALNDYFTDRTHGFTYSTQTKTGDSGNALLDFLLKKQGYCEQYAAAMAVMLRVARIPSRVVIGYTHRTRSTEGVWSVQTSDAHAWVEAYFGSDVGWVPFDPTPLQDGRSIDLGYAPHGLPPPTAVPTMNGSTGSNSPGVTRTGPFDPNDIQNRGGGSTSQPGVFTPRVAVGSLLVLALLGLVLAPGAARILVRRRRLRDAGDGDPAVAARTAWDEVLASSEDYGIPVPDTETPRRTASRLSRELDLDGPATAGLRLTALAEERARYAPVAGVEGDLPTAVRAVRRGMRAMLSRRTRLHSALLPLSTLRAARMTATERARRASTSVNRLTDALRHALIPRRLATRRGRPDS